MPCDTNRKQAKKNRSMTEKSNGFTYDETAFFCCFFGKNNYFTKKKLTNKRK